jgi:hypothetical protein
MLLLVEDKEFVKEYLKKAMYQLLNLLKTSSGIILQSFKLQTKISI